MRVRVVIPVYRALNGDEMRALKHNCNILAGRDVVLVAQHGLDVGPMQSAVPGLGVVRVSDEWLGRRNGIRGYNIMMLSKEFYDLFADVDYILVCHTDAWLFRDELDEWMAAGYDCVAAPWIRRPVYNLPVVKQYLALRRYLADLRGEMSKAHIYNRIGNGGLSLRRVESFARACDLCGETIGRFLAQRHHLYNEDVFWATQPAGFRYPSVDESLRFAFDTNPAYCYRKTGGRLPMGCHSWSKPKMWRFWRGIIRE